MRRFTNLTMHSMSVLGTQHLYSVLQTFYSVPKKYCGSIPSPSSVYTILTYDASSGNIIVKITRK